MLSIRLAQSFGLARIGVRVRSRLPAVLLEIALVLVLLFIADDMIPVSPGLKIRRIIAFAGPG